ncbi:electron transport complex subunit RsxB [Polaromonas sp. CG_9.11]|uniref:electron transport complex subunit RsxB n=1 Tax=Polaromonas sp. CG_9.11 TaxID=2787730 RepID=UPI0018C91DA2|nr:electron transport complex protein RnfB [Polaromonas sp. CG_9.11]
MKQIYLNTLFDRINSALPQTQCTRCGYNDCAAYAHAIASNETAINQCPPGGVEGIRRLSAVTGLPVQQLNPLNGLESPRAVAVIDEAWCIGCTLCIKACPVDAIVGSNKMMHTVIEPVCTGCELCLPACPVDCISLEIVTDTRTGWNAWSESEAHLAQRRYELHSKRINQNKRKDAEILEKTVTTPLIGTRQPLVRTQPDADEAERKREAITAALERSRAQRSPKK